MEDDTPDVMNATSKRLRQARRHEEWWHLDGSVVLELCGVMFRVYRAHLARKSPFFERLFAQASVDTVDSCPLYVLNRGAPEEFAAILKALDDGLSNAYISAKPAFKTIIPILRMATFYEFHDAREWAITHATYYFPSGVDDIVYGSDEETVEALLLAHECHVPELVKGCFYAIFIDPVLCQSDGAQRLPHADLQRLLEARSSIQHRWVAEVARAPVMVCPDDAVPDAKATCRNGKAHKRDLAYTWGDIVHTGKSGRRSIFEAGLSDPFYALTLLGNVQWTKQRFCTQCAVAMEEKWDSIRTAWWDDLIDLFELQEE